MMNIREWFRQIWPRPERRAEVLRGYAVLGTERALLADIALRGGIYSALPRAIGDAFGDGINEGRRQLALEVIKLASVDPNELWDLVERKSNLGS